MKKFSCWCALVIACMLGSAQAETPAIMLPAYLTMRTIAGDKWLSVPDFGGIVKAGSPVRATGLWIERSDGKPGVLQSNDTIRIRGLAHDPWLVDTATAGHLTAVPGVAGAGVFLVKAPTDGLLRLRQGFQIRTTNVDRWLSVTADGIVYKGGSAEFFAFDDFDGLAAVGGNAGLVIGGEQLASGSMDTASRIELGWMNITPCVKWEANNLYNSVLRSGPQELHVYARFDPQAGVEAAKDVVKTCAVAAVAACGISSAALSPSACLPAFQASFNSCINAGISNPGMRGKVIQALLNLETETTCRW